MSKTCTKCGAVKPLDDFNRKKGRVDGRSPHCKECSREDNRRYREENPEKEADRHRRYREENRDKEREYKRRYYEDNRDERLEYFRRYHEENRDIVNQGKKIRDAKKARTSNLLASKKGARYSPEEDALLLANNGMTTYQKAIELGRTYASVSVRKYRLRARVNH